MQRTTAVTAVTAALLMISGSAFAWGDGCDHRADRTLDLDAAGLAAVELQVRAGDLVVEGDASLGRIELRGKACASSDELLQKIQFSQSRAGNQQVLTTLMPETAGWGERATMDLVVRMPARLHLQLQDSSGDVRVRGIASLDATDSSGDLNVDDISGDVSLRDSSGDIYVQGVGGEVTVINDSSGDMRISKVRGDAIVQNDSSGDIVFDQIGGNAHVLRDTSGDIVAHVVGKDFTVDRDTSGDIRSRDVRGKVSVPAER